MGDIDLTAFYDGPTNTDGGDVTESRKPSDMLSSRNKQPVPDSPTLNINFYQGDVANSNTTITETNATAFRKDKLNNQE